MRLPGPADGGKSDNRKDVRDVMLEAMGRVAGVEVTKASGGWGPYSPSSFVLRDWAELRLHLQPELFLLFAYLKPGMLLPSLLLALPALATLGSAQQTPFAAPQVYLYPSPPSSSSSLPPSLTADQASSVLAHHLGDTRHAFLPDALDDLEHWAKLMWDDIKVATGLGGSGAADDGAARARGRVLVVQGVQDPSGTLFCLPLLLSNRR